MARSIIERIRAEKEARKAAREAHAESSASERVAGPRGQAPEIAFIEAFLTRFSAEVVPIVSKAMTQELQSALRPFYHEVRECIRETFDATAVEISKGLAALEQRAATPATDVEAVADDDEGNADTNLEIPSNELKRELERIIEDPAALELLAEEAENATGEHDPIILGSQPEQDPQHWTSESGVFTDAVVDTVATAELDELEGINNEELEALEEAATASQAVSTTDDDGAETVSAIADTVDFDTATLETAALEEEALDAEGDDEDGNDTVLCYPIEEPDRDALLETTEPDEELETDEVTDAEARTIPDASEEPPEQQEQEIEAEEEEPVETERNATEAEAETDDETNSASAADEPTSAEATREAPAVGALTVPGELTELVQAIQDGQNQLAEKIEYLQVLISANFESLVARVETAVAAGIKRATAAKVD